MNDIFSESAAAHAAKSVAIECIKRQPFFENRLESDIDKRIEEEFEEEAATRAEKLPWRILIVATIFVVLASNPPWVITAVHGIFSFQSALNHAVDHLYQEGVK